MQIYKKIPNTINLRDFRSQKKSRGDIFRIKKNCEIRFIKMSDISHLELNICKKDAQYTTIKQNKKKV